jgi:hypothetical protein
MADPAVVGSRRLRLDILCIAAPGAMPVASFFSMPDRKFIGDIRPGPQSVSSAVTGRIAAFAPPIQRQGVTPGG